MVRNTGSVQITAAEPSSVAPILTVRSVTLRPPSVIPVKMNYQYFSLDRSGAAWETIKRSRNFGAYVPAEIKNPRLELILIPSSESSKKTA